MNSEDVYQDQTFKSHDFSGKSFKGVAFDDVVFESCQFVKSDWEGACFSRCRFRCCNLTLVLLKGCRFQSVVFEECKIVGLDFYKCAKVLHVAFNKCSLQMCNFADQKLKGTSFAGSKVKDVHFKNSDLSEVDFRETDLLGTIFHYCNLTKADFRNAINYIIDLHTNTLAKAKFSYPEAMNLLRSYDIEIS